MPHGEVTNPETDKRVKRTENTLNLLRQAAAIDCTWAECAFYAGISEKSLYEWFADGERGKKLREELEGLRNKPVLKARQSLVRGLDDPDRALRYLERKRKSEFSLRQELAGPDGGNLGIIAYPVSKKNYDESEVPLETNPETGDSTTG